MSDYHYKEQLTQDDLLRLIKNGSIEINLETGEVSKLGQRLKPYVGNKEGHLFVRIYSNKKRKTIASHRLVWMASTDSVIPIGWEIHHIDGDTQNNSAINLVCLHPIDHRKFHNGEEDDTPF